jgi:hypothetical protein
MNETEVESLVVRLVGDGTSYEHMLEKAAKQTEAMYDKVLDEARKAANIPQSVAAAAAQTAAQTQQAYASQTAGQGITAEQFAADLAANKQRLMAEAFGKATVEVKQQTQAVSILNNGYQQLIAGAGALAGALAFKSRLTEAFNLFSKGERAASDLRVAIMATGQDVDELTEKFSDLASEIKEATGVGKGAITSLLAKGTSAGLSPEQAAQAAQDAIVLAKGNGDAAQSTVRLTIEMQRGNTMMIARRLGLRGMNDETQRSAEVARRLAIETEQLSEYNQSAKGQLDLLNRSVQEMKKGFGGAVAEGVGPYVEIVKSVVTWTNSLSTTTKQWIVVIASTIAGLVTIAAIAPTVVAVYTSLKAIIIGLYTAGAASLPFLAALAAGLFAVSVVAYAFTDGFKENRQAAADLNEELKRSALLTDELTEARRKATVAEIKGLPQDPEKRLAAVKDALAREKAALEAQKKHLEGMKIPEPLPEDEQYDWEKGAVKALVDHFTAGYKLTLRAVIGATTSTAQAQLIAGGEAIIGTTRETIKKLEEERKKLEGPGSTKVNEEAADALTQKLKEEAETWGLTGNAAKLAKLSLKGVSEEKLSAARAMIEIAKTRKETEAFDNSLFKFQESLEHSIDTMGMSADEVKLYDLRQQALRIGLDKATQAVLDQQRALMDAKSDMEDYNKIMEKVRNLVDSLQTPQEKFADTLENITDLRDRDLISIETYTRGMAKATKELMNHTEKQIRLQQVSYDSAEALERINEQTEKFAVEAAAIRGEDIALPKVKREAGAAAGGAEAATRQEQQMKILEKMNENLKKLVNQGEDQPDFEFSDADLT